MSNWRLLKWISSLALIAIAVLWIGAATAADPLADSLIPREVFFGNPDRTSVQISPDGAHVSYLAPYLGVLNVWVQKLGEQEAKAVTTSKDRPVRTHFWAY